MKRITCILFLTIFLTSCTLAPTETPATEVPIPTTTSIPPTEEPHILLQTDTVLYSGPSNVDFDPLATMKAGDTVYPLATYADFVKVKAYVKSSEMVGFIHTKDLSDLPTGLPELSMDGVPLRPLFFPQCSSGDYNSASDMLIFENNTDNYDVPIASSFPVSLIEPLHLRINGISATEADGSIRLFGHLSTTDSFLDGLITLGIHATDGKYTIDILDGKGGQYHSGDLGLAATETMQIVFEQVEGMSFQVFDGKGALIRRIDLAQQSGLTLPNGLFPDRQVYIAPSLPPHSTLTLTGLQIGTLAKGQWIEIADLYPGLAQLAATHHLTFGTEFSIEENTDPRYCRAMRRDFNVAVLNQFSSGWIWRDGPDQYDFSVLDREVDYAVKHGWRVRASHLIWGDYITIPDWLMHGKFTRDQYIQFLKQYIQTVVGRYKGRVNEWSIANEAISRSCKNCTGADFWNEKIGPEYIEMAFRWTHEVDPSAVLIFNDANNECPRDNETKRVVAKMYDTVKNLKEKGVPIDVVGMEMHLLVKYSSPIPPNKDDVLATMRKFADLGVKIYVTEFDVDLHKHAGTPQKRLQFEADLYKTMLEACLESNACDSFSTWGVADATSWITQVCSDSWCISEPDGAPLMFDNDYNPKPAYFAVRDVLENFPTISSP